MLTVVENVHDFLLQDSSKELLVGQNKMDKILVECYIISRPNSVLVSVEVNSKIRFQGESHIVSF